MIKEVKKKIIGFVFLFLISCLTLNFISAQGFYLDLRYGSEKVIQLVTDFAGPLLSVILGGDYYGGFMIFEKFLLFIIIFTLVFFSLKKIGLFDEQIAAHRIVSLAVTILAVRFIDLAWLNTILLQYTVLGIALTSILPFIIYLFFLHSIDSPTVRKVGWIFFIVVFYGLWSTSSDYNYGGVYAWTIVISLVFLILDKTIHRYFVEQALKEVDVSAVTRRIADLDKTLGTIENAGHLDDKTKQKEIKKIKKQIDWYRKSL